MGEAKKLFVEDTSEICFLSKETETSWLKECYTGYLKSEFNWEENGEEIQSECAGKLKLSKMGGNMLLIQSSDGNPLEKNLFELDEWT